MGRDNGLINAFNRGMVSPKALARIEIDRVRESAELQRNLIPRVLGSAMFRPGTEFVGDLGAESLLVPFVFSKTDTAILQYSTAGLRVWVDEELITRTAVSTTITNGGFATDLTGWTDADEAGTTSEWSNTGASGATGGYMKLTGTGFSSAIRRQTLTVTDLNIEHALRIIVESGPIRFRIGSTSGGEELVTETELWTGEHSIAFTPSAASVYVEISASRKHPAYVSSIAIESGVMALTSPYSLGNHPEVRMTDSGDVIFYACRGLCEYRTERRSTRSWSIVKHQPEDGPWRKINTTKTNLTPSAISGAITLTASRRIFKAGHVGALFRLESIGQLVTQSVSGENQWSGEIRVTGASTEQRRVVITRAGTWSGTISLQRSVAEPGAWTTVATYTNNATVNYDDGLDDQIIWYRIGIDAGDYTSGTADLTLDYANGSIIGTARVVSVTSETVVNAHVISDLGGTDASNVWWEGAWSDYRGHPSAITLFEARLWHGGKGSVFGSVIDSYLSHDDFTVGDEGPVSRTIGDGPIDNVNWLIPMQRLLLSTDMQERSAKSSSLDDPLTPSAFSLKRISSQGSKRVSPTFMDDMGVFIQSGGKRAYALRYNTDATVTTDYAPEDLTALFPEAAGDGSFVSVGFQRQPDTRIHFVRDDGKVAILVHDRVEDVKAWIEYETDGEVKQMIMLPGDGEDKVYYQVERDGEFYLERWALESECQGGTINKMLDSHVVYSGASTSTITGLGHHEGKTVWGWSNGDVVGPFTVSSGQITLPAPTTYAVVGLTYQWRFRGVKLAFASERPLLQKRRVAQLGLMLGPSHREAVSFGQDFDNLDPLPIVEKGELVTADHTAYDNVTVPLNGTFDTDARVCLQGDAPKHCTLLAMVVNMELNEKNR